CDVRLMVSVPFFFQAEDGIRDFHVTGVQTCALPISSSRSMRSMIVRRRPWAEAVRTSGLAVKAASSATGELRKKGQGEGSAGTLTTAAGPAQQRARKRPRTTPAALWIVQPARRAGARGLSPGGP